MILNFPYLHKDELLYSGIARYFDYLNEDRIKWVIEHLFNTRGVRAVVGFPAGLNNLSGNLPKGSPYTPDFLVNKHTLYPLFRPFIDLSRHEKIISDMFFENGKGLKTRLGIVASVIPNKRSLYYCPSCVKSQMDQHNPQFFDVFWNRIHQCPGVLVCHHHKELLKQTSFILEEINQHRYVSVNFLVKSGQLDLKSTPVDDSITNQAHVQLVENIEWIMNNNIIPRDLNYYRSRYIEYLKSKGIAKPSGHVDVLRFKKLFLDFYPKKFLQQLHSDFDINDEQTWVQMMIQKNRKAFHPIRHILMIRLLAGSVSEFFMNEYTYSPFGKGPWECNNPVCVTKTKLICIDYSSDCKKVYGEFLCKCGFKERRYLDGKTKVMEFGEVWEQRLVKLIQEGKGIYTIAKLLKADIETIKKYAEKHNILDKWVPSRKNTTVRKNQTIINKENYYELWINTIQENLDLNKNEIRALIPATYAWLYRNDKHFLMENSPTHSSISESQIGRVDWTKRDTEMLKKVTSIVANWDTDYQKPKRKTKTSIGKKTLKMYWLEKFPEYFPETLAFLESAVEPVDEFQIRRVKWLLNNDFNRKFVKEWQIYRKAGLRSDISDKVKVYIRDEVMQHNINVSKVIPQK
jgi:hypothetical protein